MPRARIADAPSLLELRAKPIQLEAGVGLESPNHLGPAIGHIRTKEFATTPKVTNRRKTTPAVAAPSRAAP